MTLVVTGEVTGITVTDVQSHSKRDTDQGDVVVPTLIFQKVFTVRVVVEGPLSKVVLVYVTIICG